MRRESLAVALLFALTACDRPLTDGDARRARAGDGHSAAPATSAVKPTHDPKRIAKARKHAQSVLKCLSHVGTLETVWTAECFVPHMPVDVVDHIPTMAPRNTRLDAAEVLSFSLALDLESPRFRPELLLSDGQRVVVSGVFEARSVPTGGHPDGRGALSETGSASRIAVPTAAATLLDDKGRMREARIYFDQRSAAPPSTAPPSTASHAGAANTPSNSPPSSARPPKSAPPKSAPPKAVVVSASHDVAEAEQVRVLDRVLAASRRGDVSALRALYSANAVLRDRGLGADVHGAEAIAKQLGANQHIEVEQRWAAGTYAIAELRRSAADAAPVRSLEIFRFDAGLVAEHFQFHSRYRSDTAAGIAEPPSARVGAAAIREATSVTLLEGLPHQAFEEKLLVAELKAKRVLRRHRYPFYTDPLPLRVEHAQWLTEILVDARAMNAFSGEKKCGGFHPDYAVRFQKGAKTYDALVCFGCGELKWVANGKTTRYDIAHWAALNLETVLHSYRRQRPSSSR